MNPAWSAIRSYWAAGGPLLPLIALLSFGIWAYFFRTRRVTLQLRRALRHSVLTPTEETQWRVCARRDLVVLSALTAAAPLLGLLGTVLGMVGTFDAVSGIGDTSQEVAGGIRQALITTQFGLLAAIPGVFGLARLQRAARQVDVHLALRRSERRLEAAV